MKLLCLLFSLATLVFPVMAYGYLDNFNGAGLGPEWTVVHPNDSYYSVSGGYLHTNVLPGDLWDTGNNYSNLFIIANPFGAGDFVATMKVENFIPISDWQQIDIVAYDDDANHVRCINGYVFGARNWEFVYEVNDQGNNSSNGAGHVAMNPIAEDFYLRLEKTGNQYKQFYSYDGITFIQSNGTITYGDGSPAYLGLVALAGSQTPVDIDYFQVVSSAPLPGTFLFLGSGLLGLIGLRRLKTS